jgi:hypothetical protein
MLAALPTAAANAAGGSSSQQSELDVTLGVFFDPAGTVCSGTIRPGAPGTIYIVARSAPGTEIISGAEFRFSGLPPSWTVYAIPNPLCLNLGDPFGAGAGIAASQTQCQPQWSTFLMYTVLVFASTEVDNVQFQLTHRDPPTNPALRCPLVTDCGGVVGYMEMHCVQPTPCFVNMTDPAACEKPTAVASATWSQVRGMYR